MKNPFKRIALVGLTALVLGGCGRTKNVETETFTGIVQDKEIIHPYNVYTITNKKDTIYSAIHENAKDIFEKEDSVKIGYANVFENQFIYQGDWEHEENKGTIKGVTMVQLKQLSALVNYEILKKGGQEKKILIKEYLQENNSVLQKYNLENKQINDDFIEFVKENNNCKQTTTYGFFKEYGNKSVFATLSKNTHDKDSYDVDLSQYVGEKRIMRFDDRYGDGLYASDSYNDSQNSSSVKFIKDFSSDRQLELAKECTNLKAETMHKENYKNY